MDRREFVLLGALWPLSAAANPSKSREKPDEVEVAPVEEGVDAALVTPT
jgi:hypothetical protein